jgi:hypothetical protein
MSEKMFYQVMRLCFLNRVPEIPDEGVEIYDSDETDIVGIISDSEFDE